MRRAALFLGLATALAACEAPAPPPDPAPPPVAQPEAAPPAGPSAASQAVRRYFERVEANQVARGLLRVDGGGPDTPWSARDLADAFERIAFFQEYDTSGPRPVSRDTPSVLHRWTGPVRVEARFGESVDAEERTEIRRLVSGYAARLASITGHPIQGVPSGGNFVVFFVDEDERQDIAPDLAAVIPGMAPQGAAFVAALPLSADCVAFAGVPDEIGVYTSAFAVIRAEHPPRLRLSCIHEEIAQGLGLSNDSPQARPSIFNDDDEFGRLTSLDEGLLRMLYDPRLQPGMSLETARPIIARIAREIAPDARAPDS